MVPLISIIVPVFNVQDYLTRCVDSIINQSIKEIEIILVDDGSTDASSRICDNYRKLDDRIKVIHKDNGGLSDARNIGIDAACGKYIGFVDSDDFIHRDMYLLLYQTIVENQCDIAEAGYQEIYHYNDIKEPDENPSIILYTRKQAVISTIMNYHCQTYAWNKLYKKELWKNIRFPKGKLFEDQFTTYRIANRAEKVAVLNKNLYYYFQREDSIIHASFSLKSLDHYEALNSMMTFVTSEYPEALQITAVKYFKDNLWHLQELLINRKKIAGSVQMIRMMTKDLIFYSKYLGKKINLETAAKQILVDHYGELLKQRKRVGLRLFLLKKSVWLFYSVLTFQLIIKRLVTNRHRKLAR